MVVKRERGLRELYSEDPQRADHHLWGRKADPSTRRGFLKKSGLAAMSAAIGAAIPFASRMPSGLLPAAFAQEGSPNVIPGKEGLVVLNDRPLNAEAMPHYLNDDFTPNSRMFVRNNGLPPDESSIDPDKWTLVIDGEVEKPMTFTIPELKKKFRERTLALVIECGGNGRAGYYPPAKGNQWTYGAIHCAKWTGVRLKDVLDHCGLKESAVYIGYYGADVHISGDPDKVVISRGVPIYKAMEDESLIAWGVNGGDIPLLHGHPLRLVTSGWPGSTCGKWLKRIWVRDRVHDGPKMVGSSYRTPCEPVAPGAKVADEDMCVIEAMPVKSLVTYPVSGVKTSFGGVFKTNGHAWVGDAKVRRMEVSIDFGATWMKARLNRPVNRLAWQNWSAELKFPSKGYYEVWARATDSDGVSQPVVIPGWNPKGYLNNSCHRIAVYMT